MTNKDIMRIATEQSALEANCSPEDFFRSENIVTISTGNKGQEEIWHCLPTVI